MPIYRLDPSLIGFPDPNGAVDGVVAVGGDLSTDRLILAYDMGLFPWYNPDEPIIWWSPDPRFVIYPDEIRISKSMRKLFRDKSFTVTTNQSFVDVLCSCRDIYREGQEGETWITDDIKSAYTKLHEIGIAHSVEVWNGDELVGGLYGLIRGNCFFGESMFARESNASKYGFISMVKALGDQGIKLIDCQTETKHLVSLGARGIPREEFLEILYENHSLIGQEVDFNNLF